MPLTVAPSAFCISVSATLTMLVSTTSSSAPRETAIAIIHFLVARASTSVVAMAVDMGLPAGIDGEVDAETRPQRNGRWDIGERNSHRQPLHDLGVVAGRVVGRQQAEAGTRRRREALDRPVQ